MTVKFLCFIKFYTKNSYIYKHLLNINYVTKTLQNLLICYTFNMKTIKLDQKQVKLLGLSRNEIKVFNSFEKELNTPVSINQKVNLSRPAIYKILNRLHKRGLVKNIIRNGKNYWIQTNEKLLEKNLFETKKALLGFNEGVEEVKGVLDSMVVVHRGKEAVQKILNSTIKNNKNQRLQAIQGDNITTGWKKVFGEEKMNEFNRFVKRNQIITEIILPIGWFERQARLLGKKWAINFEGRMAIGHEIDEDYFNHAGQIWIFKNSLYLVAINEEVVIEIRNSEISKLILSMFSFIQDNSKKFDVNQRLRDIIEKYEEKGVK